MQEGVRPRKLVDEVVFFEVAGSGRDADESKGSVSSSTGEGSSSCMGMAEIEVRDSRSGSVAVDAMLVEVSCCADRRDSLSSSRKDDGLQSRSPRGVAGSQSERVNYTHVRPQMSQDEDAATWFSFAPTALVFAP